jgi:hypothetical protein
VDILRHGGAFKSGLFSDFQGGIVTMNTRAHTRLLCLSILALGCFTTIGGIAYGRSRPKSGAKSSDPQLTGARDMNYDHLIIAGDRIGPVRMGGLVTDAVQHLGNPNNVYRSTFRGPGYSSDEVYYYYKDECISFTWTDDGLAPQIERGLRGINVTCDKWSTPDGLHVGSPMQDIAAHVGQYCPSNRDNGSLIIATKQGIWYEGKNRYSPISIIRVMPVMDTWGGMCKD